MLEARRPESGDRATEYFCRLVNEQENWAHRDGWARPAIQKEKTQEVQHQPVGFTAPGADVWKDLLAGNRLHFKEDSITL